MRILMLNWRGPGHPRAGGAEVYTSEVLSRMAARGHNVTWFTADHSTATSPVPHVEMVDGVRVIRRGSTLGVYRAARRFAARNAAEFDVVVDQVNTVPFNPHLPGVPVVNLIHQLAREVWTASLPAPAAFVGREIAEPWWLSRIRHRTTFTVSPSSADSLLSAGFSDVVDLGEGISLPEGVTSLAKQLSPTLLYVGRLAANKRPLHFLEAASRLLPSFPNLAVWVVGDGPQRMEVERAASVLSAAGADVSVFGRVDTAEKFALMSRAWALVVPSSREGWALVVDEAASVGTFSVGYPVPGLCDSIPAAGGVLAESCSVESLAAAARAGLERAAASAGSVVEGWAGGARSWDEVTDNFEAALSAKLARFGTSPAFIANGKLF